jgi:hypothetical protein
MAPRMECTTPLPLRPGMHPPRPAPPSPQRPFRTLLGHHEGLPTAAPPPMPPTAPRATSAPRPGRMEIPGERRPHDHDPTPEAVPSPNRDLLEPLERTLWHLRPPATSPPPASPPPSAAALPPVDQLIDRLLRRIALGGSRHRGTAFLEIGAGNLEGASVTIHAEGSRLCIEVEAPEGEASRRWRHQLQERLRARGLEAEVTLR